MYFGLDKEFIIFKVSNWTMRTIKLTILTVLFLTISNMVIGQRNKKPCEINAGRYLTVGSTGTCDGSTWDLADLSGAAYGTNANHDFGTPSCAVNGAEDAWFAFTAPASGNVDITTQAGTINALAIEIYASNCPSAGTSLGCVDGNGAMLTVNLSALIGGDTYFIRMWSENDVNSNGSFNICLEDPGGAVTGCTDPTAHNYNAAATVDNGA